VVADRRRCHPRQRSVDRPVPLRELGRPVPVVDVSKVQEAVHAATADPGDDRPRFGAAVGAVADRPDDGAPPMYRCQKGARRRAPHTAPPRWAAGPGLALVARGVPVVLVVVVVLVLVVVVLVAAVRVVQPSFARTAWATGFA
jgi:hypothetical protein